jgi:hypothetical protein
MITFDNTLFTVLYVATLAAATLGVALTLALGVDFLSRNRRVRVARSLSIPTYYRGLALHH